ncbi:unnamed protein product, partial [Ixodes persulcatus]
MQASERCARRAAKKRHRDASSNGSSEVEMKSEPESDFEPSLSSSVPEDSEGKLVIELDAEDDLKSHCNGLDIVGGCCAGRAQCCGGISACSGDSGPCTSRNIKSRGKRTKLKAKNKTKPQKSLKNSAVPQPPPSASNGTCRRRSARQAQQTLKRYREALSDDNSEVEMKSEPESDFEPSVSSSPAKDSEGSLVIELDSEDDLKPLGSWASLNSSIKPRGKSSKLKAKNKRHRKIPMRDGADLTEDEKKAAAMKQTLLERLERLGEKLPPNTLDQLIDELGGPNCVAEMTGRRGRVVSTAKGTVQYEPRAEVDVPLKTLNLTEKQRFMDGEKRIAIISEAASLGISLHSDRRAKNQARRVHLTLELPWSADRAVQQFGRTHRSNQVNAPEYVFLISDLAGERRFASIVAKRLESLGALTHGDRRAGESRDLSRFNIDNRYGNEALQTMMSDLMEVETSPLIPPPKDWEGDFFADSRKALVGVGLVNENELTKVQILDKDYTNMSQFLNRILGIPVELQNAMFKYFTDTLDAIVSEAKRAGHYDLGILDLGTSGDNVRREEARTFVRSHATGTAKTELHTVGVERGLAFDASQKLWKELLGTDEGYYLSHKARNGKRAAVLAVCDEASCSKGEDPLVRLYKPHTGLQVQHQSLAWLKSKFRKVTPDEAQPHWKEQYESSENTCSHVYWLGSCRTKTCEVGLRRRKYHVLSGSVLAIWAKVESVLSTFSKLQVVRFKTEDSLRI